MSESMPSNTRLKFERPLVSVDVVIFTMAQPSERPELQVLLVERPRTPQEPYPGQLALPGGFVDVAQDSDLRACAMRKLKEKTGVRTSYLEQLGSWGGRERDPRGWSTTHVYFALVPADAIKPQAASVQAGARWALVDQALTGALAFDHQEILQAAVDRLLSKVEYTSLPAFLLAEPFTLRQLQDVYEAILGRALDKSAFRRRMLDAQFLEEAGSVTAPSGHTAQGYRIQDRTAATVFPRMFKSAE